MACKPWHVRLLVFLVLVPFVVSFLLLPSEPAARSAYSPRHTGLEPPGGPRALEAIPGRTPGRTPEGGMGYTDAYGNTLTERPEAEKKARVRPRPGAYGTAAKKEDSRPLPDPGPQGPPLWKFR